MRTAIVGIGWSGFRPSVPELSFTEMMYEAAVRAYEDAGVDARRDVDVFVSCQEDFWEGIAINDEFAPDPVGGVMRPTVTVAGDGLQCVGQAYMMIRSGLAELVAVEAHGKPSDVKTLQEIYELALDPQLRALKPGNPFFLAGLDAVAYMRRSGARREHFALVAVKNRRRGLRNPRASHAASIELKAVLNARPAIYPLTRHEIAGFTDAAISVVMASEQKARELRSEPIWLEGIWWSTEVGSGSVEWHEWGSMPSARLAAKEAYRQAGLKDPRRQTDFAEVEDRFSFMELLFLEELGMAPEGAHKLLESGYFDAEGSYPVNPSGGSLSLGTSFEATGLMRLLEAVLQLRGEAGGVQLRGAERAVVASWRGVPSYTSAVAVLGR
ncbi:MAG: thiolase domain-containing protein [Acidilobaceae archaeon]|nr:thiolase domain-containing protein [Acidilobaceae archaeon]